MPHLPRDRRFWILVRIFFICALLISGMVAVGHGAWNLGVTRRTELTEIAREQYTRKVRLSARRGMITDRNGQELAVEVEVDSVYTDPREIVSPRSAAALLAPILGKDPVEIETRLTSRKHFAWLKRRVSPEVARQIKELKLPGVYLQKESKRFYPNRELAAHVIGFSGLDSNGLEGIEKRFDDQLRGDEKATAGLSDAAGNIVFSAESLGTGRAVGDNISLTIDRYLQFTVEQELAATIRLFEARSGQIVVMNPNTGEVLALANWPTFNLNDLSNSSVDARRNRALIDVYEPGSTFKVFTLAAALNSGQLAPDEKTYCEEGRMEFYDVVLHDDHRDGWLDPTGCLARSSNICFAKIARKIGAERLYHYLRRFGFGERTNLQLPFEMRGMLSHYKNWSEFLTATIAFGQGVGVTGIQMASGLSAIANDGVLMKPYIVKEIVNSDGEMQLKSAPTSLRRVISKRTARLVTDMMTAVTEEGGTGTGGAIDGYLVAGKTGTAQKSRGSRGYQDEHHFVSSFFGFAPADNPQILISVVIDEPILNHYGGTVAAPALSRIAEKALRNMGIPPNRASRPKRQATTAAAGAGNSQTEGDVLKDADAVAINRGGPSPDPKNTPLAAGQVRTPTLIGLSMGQVLKTLTDSGLRPVLFGTGVAVEQVPAPGDPIAAGEYVQVNFQPFKETSEEEK